MLRTLIAEPNDFSPEVKKRLNRISQVEEISSLTQEEFNEALFEFDIIWFRLKYHISDISSNKKIKCKYLVCPVTGVNHISMSFLERNDVKLISLKGEYKFLSSITPTAEHTVFLTLALLRNSIQAAESVKKGSWDRDRFRGFELNGKRLGIIGFGRLGKIVAKYFKSFGCEVLINDIKKPLDSDYLYVDSLEEIFNLSDIITLHVDLNKSTFKFIDKKILSSSHGVYLINTSRGEIVDENAVLFALKNGNLKGYASDVVCNEEKGISSSKILKSHANKDYNTIFTPHIGGCTYESTIKTESFVFDKLLKIITNE